MGLYQCSVEWDNHLPQTAGYAVFDAPQDMVGRFRCQGTLLTHIQLAITGDVVTVTKTATDYHFALSIHKQEF